MAEHSSKTTTDHDTIRRWAEARGGKPARVRSTGSGEDAGVLRIEFDDSTDDLEPIAWDAFFEEFEENDLAFLYQEETKDGGRSRFNKFISR